MDAFALRLMPPNSDLLQDEGLGRIVIGDFVEDFITAPFPGCNDVRLLPAQWSQEIRKLIDGASVVALRWEPARAWVLYREGDRVFVHDILLVHEGGGLLDSSGQIRALPPRTTISVDGYAVSEWTTTVAALEAFLAS
jgi:hypothetical protein